MKIQMSVHGAVIATATLDSHDSAVDFAAMLPLDLHFTDYAAAKDCGFAAQALAAGRTGGLHAGCG